MELNIGDILTGGEYAFQGRIEILEVNQEDNQLVVWLTKRIDHTDRFSEWKESWELDIVQIGLSSGDYKAGVQRLFLDYPETQEHVHEAWDFVTKDDEGNLVMAKLEIPYTKAKMLAEKSDIIVNFYAEIHDIQITEVFTQLNRDKVL